MSRTTWSIKSRVSCTVSVFEVSDELRRCMSIMPLTATPNTAEIRARAISISMMEKPCSPPTCFKTDFAQVCINIGHLHPQLHSLDRLQIGRHRELQTTVHDVVRRTRGDYD